VRAFLRVVLPLALPGVAATAIFAFVISWNEVFAASVLTVRHKTLTGLPALCSVGEPAACAIRWRVRADHSLGAFHFSRPQAPLLDVGHCQPMSAC
jgi:ABC-type glycerol-3-phosphate transport system permease component